METPYSIRVVDAVKRFGDVGAVDHVSLDIRRGEFFSLLGPSGCGKTTLLRMIAGLEQGDGGNIVIDGVDVTALPAYRRPVNLVFQHFALFSHLTVEKNVAFGLRYREGDDKKLRRDKVAAAPARWSSTRACSCSMNHWARSTRNSARRCRSS